MNIVTLHEIFECHEPPSPSRLLRTFKLLFLRPTKLIKELRTLPRYHDEPFTYQFTATPIGQSTTHHEGVIGVGTSFSKIQAQIKALGEAAERFSLIQDSTKCVLMCANDLENTIDLDDLPEFHTDEGILSRIRRISLPWVSGYYLDSQTLGQAYLPAQLIFVPYERQSNEPVIRQPISTGAALGFGYADSILRGLLEVIERDAFMLSYYRRRINHELDPTKVVSLSDVLKELERCRLKLRLFDITTDTGAYVFLALLLDDTGYGPHLTAGMKAGYDPPKVALGAIEEAIQLRPWIRDLHMSHLGGIPKPVPNEIATLKDRAFFWLDPSLRSQLDFYLECPRVERLSSYPRPPSTKITYLLKRQLDSLSKLGVKAYFTDLTDERLFEAGFRVVKVVTTKLQPMHLDERGGIQLGSRLLDQHFINQAPHFFL
jgi:ribosomal protein S12 methylthiotransferase accessory factor